MIDVVPVVGVRTTVAVIFEFTATDPTLQITVPFTGGGQVPPGETVAELKVTPAVGNVPLKITCVAGSGPLFLTENV